MAKSKCTLKDVAKACNVSAYTVSRAINGKKDISKETKEMILGVAKKMGYIANSGARNLRIGSTNNIAVIYDDFENPYYNMVIKELAFKLQEKGYYMTMFYDFESISLLNTRLFKRVLSTNIDGIVSMISVTDNAKKLNQIWNKPLIQLGSNSLKNDIDCIYFDDFDGGYKLTKYLLDRGYKRIAFINATEKLLPGIERINGYKKALLEKNIILDDEFIIHLTETQMSISEASDKLLDLNCDCVVAYNDMTALSIKRYLKSKRVYNVLVCGFDNIQRSMPLTEHLISVYGDISKLIDLCVETLIKRINGDESEFINIKLPIKITSTSKNYKG